MPPPHHPAHPHRAATAAFIDPARIDALLAPWIEDAEGRAFVVRCLLGEGPTHHRGANFVLLALLARVVEKVGAAPVDGEGFPVPMRLPPHLARRAGPQSYPLSVSGAALERLAPKGSRELEAMADCLSDGPPQHALANAAMTQLLEAILRALEAR